MSTVEDLRSRNNALKLELAEVNKEAKRVRRAEARRTLARDRMWALSTQQLQAVMLIYILADCIHEPAVMFLKRIGRQRGWAETEDGALETMIDEAILAADLDELAGLADTHGLEESPLMRAAINVTWQWRLVVWTRTQNRKGIAPPSSLLLDQWERSRVLAPGHLRPPRWGTSIDTAARVRVFKLRKRYGCRFGKLQAREHIAVDVMRAKVVRQYHHTPLPSAPLPSIPLPSQHHPNTTPSLLQHRSTQHPFKVRHQLRHLRHHHHPWRRRGHYRRSPTSTSFTERMP